MSGTMKSTRSVAGPTTSGTLGRSAGGAAAANTLRSTASRKSTNFAMINGSRNPPRPTPSMVNYSDEDSAKGYDENPDDSDSLTEKPSEISSTDSQVICLIIVEKFSVCMQKHGVKDENITGTGTSRSKIVIVDKILCFSDCNFLFVQHVKQVDWVLFRYF